MPNSAISMIDSCELKTSVRVLVTVANKQQLACLPSEKYCNRYAIPWKNRNNHGQWLQFNESKQILCADHWKYGNSNATEQRKYPKYALDTTQKTTNSKNYDAKLASWKLSNETIQKLINKQKQQQQNPVELTSIMKKMQEKQTYEKWQWSYNTEFSLIKTLWCSFHKRLNLLTFMRTYILNN